MGMGQNFSNLFKILLVSFSLSMVGCSNEKPVEPTDYDISLENEDIDVDENQYGEIIKNDHLFSFSGVSKTDEGLIKLLNRGVVINQTPLSKIEKISVSFVSIEEATLYYGDYFLSFTDSVELKKENVIEIDKYCSYFVIQSEGESVIDKIDIKYDTSLKIVPDMNNDLPVINIDTDDAPINSRITYVDCEVSVNDPNDEANNLDLTSAQIRLRGNSTSFGPKYNYRIKFNKKQKMFGREKNKNWVLLGDYLDGSKMHNFSAYSFAEMVRDGKSFAVKPLHVRVFLNNVDLGIYLFGEHVDEKKGRLDIETDEVWNVPFENASIYFERNGFVEPEDVEMAHTVFTKYDPPFDKYIFCLKYPEKDDFIEEKDDGTIVEHYEEYDAFFAKFCSYIDEVCGAFLEYEYNYNSSTFEAIEKLADLNSLATYAATDQVFAETDHRTKSFKMYRIEGGKLQFGPNWDYDSCVDGLHYSGSYDEFPYTSKEKILPGFSATWFGERWGYTLFKDSKNGKKYFKEIWNNLSDEKLSTYIANQYAETKHISSLFKIDTSIWMKNNFHAVFDNLTYHYRWLETQIRYLKDLYK